MKIIFVQYGLIAVTNLGIRTLKYKFLLRLSSSFPSNQPADLGVMLGPSGEEDSKAHMAVLYLPV